MLDQPWSVFIRLEAMDAAYADFEKLEDNRRKARQRRAQQPKT